MNKRKWLVFLLPALTLFACENLTFEHEPRVVMGHDASEEIPNFDHLVKSKASRLTAEMYVFDGWVKHDPKLKAQISKALEEDGGFYDTSVVAPNFLYRVRTIRQAEHILNEIFEQDLNVQSKRLKLLANKASGISVAFVEPDSVLFIFFDQNNRLMSYHYD